MSAAPFSRLWPSPCWGPHPYIGEIFFKFTRATAHYRCILCYSKRGKRERNHK
nr:MAG TPA: hypothetical protein [Caudoviricetes sp.]